VARTPHCIGPEQTAISRSIDGNLATADHLEGLIETSAIA
jgi:hypothetical protein